MPNPCIRTSPDHSTSQEGKLTATEIIGGIEWRITLAPDATGRYREVQMTPVRASCQGRAVPISH